MLPTSSITGHTGSTHAFLYQMETVLIFVAFWSVAQTVKHGDY
jgi:hypothetical protein